MGRKGFYTVQILSPVKPSHSSSPWVYACVRTCVSWCEVCVRVFAINSAHALSDSDVDSRVTNYRDVGLPAANRETVNICRPITCRHTCQIEEEGLTGK